MINIHVQFGVETLLSLAFSSSGPLLTFQSIEKEEPIRANKEIQP